MQEIQDLERKKTYLRLGLVAAAIPALPGILISKLGAFAERMEGKFFPLKDQKPQTGKPLALDERLLPPDHPLARMVITEARKQGFETAGVFLEDADRSFSNASVSDLGKDKNGKENFTMWFNGNPLEQENGQALARGVIGHELGHLKTSSSLGRFRKYGLETADVYSRAGKGAILTAVVGKVAAVAGPLLLAPSLPVHQRILDAAGHLASAGPLLATTALATGTMAYLTRRLIQSHAHATEHIADLHGAKNTSPQDVAGVLAYLERQREEMREETTPRQKTLREIFHAAVHPEEYTHPSPESRISLLNKAFRGESAAPVWAGQPGAMVGALAERKPDSLPKLE